MEGSSNIIPTKKKKGIRKKKPTVVKPRKVDAVLESFYETELETPEAEKLRQQRQVAKAVKTSRVRKAREDPNEFAEYAFQDSVSGNDLVQADIHRELQNSLIDPDNKFLLVEFPRNHGKTTQVEINTIWELGNDPNLRFKFVCESDARAIERIQLISQHIEKNPRVSDVFPHLKPARKGDWTKKKIVVERSRIMRDVSIEACGVQTAATGGRADRLVADDPVGRRNALEQPKLRESVKRAWHSDWLNLLEPEGKVRYICTPWHTADLTHELKKNPSYKVFSRPVGPHFEPVWSAKWPRKALKAKLREIGRREFDRGYRLIALSGEFATVSEDWIRYWKGELSLNDLIFFSAYDLSTGQGDDFFACVHIALDGRDLGLLNPRIYVLDAWRAHLSFLAQVESIRQEAVRWHPEMIAIEATQYQVALPQFLNSTTLLPIQAVKPRLSKALRLYAVSHLFEQGKILLNPALNPRSGFKPELVDELSAFPLGANDDLVDAIVYAVAIAVDYATRAGKSIDATVTGANIEREIAGRAGEVGTAKALEEYGNRVNQINSSMRTVLGQPKEVGRSIERWAKVEER